MLVAAFAEEDDLFDGADGDDAEAAAGVAQDEVVVGDVFEVFALNAAAVVDLHEELAGRGYRPVSLAIRAVPGTPDDLGVVLKNQADLDASAARVLGVKPAEIPACLQSLGDGLGAPWRREQRIAVAAAIGALERERG